MTDRNANVIWQARKCGSYPNGHVRCDKSDLLITVEPGDGHGYTIRMPRRLARLIAKRINQCLDQT